MQYENVHSAVTDSTRGRLQLTTPIPGSGSVGSLILLVARPQQLKIGDRLTVTTAGTRYTYFVSADTQLGYSATAVPVLPAIQATHSNGDVGTMPISPYLNQQAVNAIVTANCGSADITAPDTRKPVVPSIRPWPWSDDSYGVPWDQPNLWALLNLPIEFSKDFYDPAYSPAALIPVPKTIGPEYTQFTYRGIVPANGYYSFYYLNNMAAIRTATDAKDRQFMANAQYRYNWRPLPQNFPTINADPDFTTVGWYQVVFPSHAGEYVQSWKGGWQSLVQFTTGVGTTGQHAAFGPGIRGGRYSLCGNSANSTGTYFGLTVQIWAREYTASSLSPSGSDILLKSIHCNGGPAINDMTVTTGTWSGVQIPADTTGTCWRVAIVVIPDTPDPFASANLTNNSNITLCASTQIPWYHHVVTGNNHAPGGLIAPFY